MGQFQYLVLSVTKQSVPSDYFFHVEEVMAVAREVEQINY